MTSEHARKYLGTVALQSEMRTLSLLATLLGSLLALATPAAAEVTEELEIQTRDGATVHVEIARPDGNAKVPVILTYSPYNSLGGNPVGNLASGSEWVAKGYARAVADVVGTRNSSGCWDYGGLIEQRSGVDVVNELAKQPWSNGKVGMTGVSYEGTTANMVAAAGSDAPGLAAIVPIAAISRWYGYAYQDGVRYALNSQHATDEGLDTPLLFDFGFALTPPDRPGSAPAMADRVICDQADHTAHGYDDTPDYDQFWLERDYRKDAAKFQVPVMVVHGWQDFNVKQAEGVHLYEQIPVDDPATAAREGVPFKLLHMSQEPHADGEGDGYTERLNRFFARTLKGENNGIEFETAVRSRGRSGETAGTWMRSSAWPPRGTVPLSLRLGYRSRGVLEADAPATPPERAFDDTAVNTEEAAFDQWPDELPGQLIYISKPFEQDTRIAGTPVLRARLKVDGADGQLSPTLVEVTQGDPAETAVPITRGHMNLLYRDSLATQKPVPANSAIGADVKFAPIDHTIKRGRSIAVLVAASNTVWAIPNRTPRSYSLIHGESRLELPVVGPEPAAVVHPPHTAGPVPARRTRALTATLKRVRSGLMRVSGRAPAGARLTVRLRRGTRTVATGRVRRVARNGRYSVRIRVRGRSRSAVRALVSARLIGGDRLSARSRAVRARR